MSRRHSARLSNLDQRGLLRACVCSHKRPFGWPAEGASLLERLEKQKKLTADQWKIIATANVGDMLDFFDFFLIG